MTQREEKTLSTAPKKESRITADLLTDKAERYMRMQGLSPRMAAAKALPDDLLSIRMADIRTLMAEGLARRITGRDAAARMRSSERRDGLAKRMTDEALGKLDGAVRERAQLLATISYVWDGRRLSLLDMPLAAHDDRASRDRLLSKQATKRADFHSAAAKALRERKVARIAELPRQAIVDLALQAETVWR